MTASARLVAALIAGATVTMPLALLAAWVLATLPFEGARLAFARFETHRDATLLAWLALSLAHGVGCGADPAAPWRRMLGALAAVLLAVPAWSLLLALAGRPEEAFAHPAPGIAVGSIALAAAAIHARGRIGPRRVAPAPRDRHARRRDGGMSVR